MNDREELEALRRLAELEEKAANVTQPVVKKAPPSPPGGRIANLIKQGVDKGIAGLGGLPGDLAQLEKNFLGGSVASWLPTSKTIYEKGFAPPEYLRVEPEGFGEKALEFGAETIPSLILTALNSKPIQWVKGLSEWIYKTGMKPSTTLTPIERTRLARTAIKERIPYSEKGGEKLLALKESLGKELEKVVNAGSQVPNRTAGDLADAVLALKDKYKNLRKRDAIWSALDEYADDIINVHGGGNPNTLISPQKLQEIKKDFYTINPGSYGKTPLEIGTEKAADKAIARATKEAVDEAIPEAMPINKRLSRIKELEPHLIRAAGRTGNYEPLSPFDIIAGVATGQPIQGMATTGAMRMARFPNVRSQIAFGLDRLGSSDTLTKYLILEALRNSMQEE